MLRIIEKQGLCVEHKAMLLDEPHKVAVAGENVAHQLSPYLNTRLRSARNSAALALVTVLACYAKEANTWSHPLQAQVSAHRVR